MRKGFLQVDNHVNNAGYAVKKIIFEHIMCMKCNKFIANNKMVKTIQFASYSFLQYFGKNYVFG